MATIEFPPPGAIFNPCLGWYVPGSFQDPFRLTGYEGFTLCPQIYLGNFAQEEKETSQARRIMYGQLLPL